jgi:hypothetical protein
VGRIGNPPAGRTKVVLANVPAGMVLEGTVPMGIWFCVTVVILNPMVLVGLIPMVLWGLTAVVWTTGLLPAMWEVLGLAGLAAIRAPTDLC